MNNLIAKPLFWMGSSKKDLMSLPLEVRKFFGHALNFATHGCQHNAAKVLSGFGCAGVIEIIEDNIGGTYRVVYTVKFSEAVFVLHCFQKKVNTEYRRPKRTSISFASD
jgi:phage-related protein